VRVSESDPPGEGVCSHGHALDVFGRAHDCPVCDTAARACFELARAIASKDEP
jgi:hypothetical protein